MRQENRRHGTTLADSGNAVYRGLLGRDPYDLGHRRVPVSQQPVFVGAQVGRPANTSKHLHLILASQRVLRDKSPGP